MIRQATNYLENLPGGIMDWAVTLGIIYVVSVIITSFRERRIKATIKTEETLDKIVQPVSGQVDIHIRLLEFNLNIFLSGPARLLLTLPIIDAYNSNYDDSHPFLDGWRGQIEKVLTTAQQQTGHTGAAIDCPDIIRAIKANENGYFKLLHHNERSGH